MKCQHMFTNYNPTKPIKVKNSHVVLICIVCIFVCFMKLQLIEPVIDFALSFQYKTVLLYREPGSTKISMRDHIFDFGKGNTDGLSSLDMMSAM